MRAFCSGSGPSADWLLRRTVGPFRAVGQRILDGKSALSAVHGCLAGARSSRTARDASNWRETYADQVYPGSFPCRFSDSEKNPCFIV